jgi:glucose-6-phosphate isomerase
LPLTTELADAAGVIFHHDAAGCLARSEAADSPSSQLLAPEQFARWLSEADGALTRLQSEHAAVALPYLKDLEDCGQVAVIEAAYARLSAGAGTIIFFGSGGASLGGQAIAQFGGWAIPGTTTPKQRRRPTTRFYDNLDAETLAALLRSDKLDRYRFIIVSASGANPDTLAQAMAAITAVRTAGLEERIADLFLGVTGPAVEDGGNGLRRLLEHFGVPMLDLPRNVGGSVAALTSVGLLAGIARGLDVRQLLKGAQLAVAQMAAADRAADLPAAVGAALTVGLSEEADVRVQAVMAYADRLMRFADWAARLWVEGGGKVGRLMLTVARGGPVDQSTTLQLAMSGSPAQLVTILRSPGAEPEPRVMADLAALADFQDMAGRSVSDLVSAQSDALVAALRAAGRPARRIDLVRYDTLGLGALLMHFMIEVILAAYMRGIDPFDQAASGLGQQLARARLAGTR